MTAAEDDRGGILRFADFGRTVVDLDRSIAFYVGALGFAHEGCPSTGRARLRLGRETIELVAAKPSNGAAGEGEIGIAGLPFQHIAIVTRDMTASAAQLAPWAPVPISRAGPVRLPAGAGGVTAFKFRDPDGHPLELIEFPAGTGDPRWHEAGTADDGAGLTDFNPINVNLGIDHSAIGIADVDRSLAFYVEALGLAVASRHRNHGPAQSRLDGLEDSVVDVLGLRPSAQRTPHLELLGRRPPAPRARSTEIPVDRDPGDRIVFDVGDLRAALRRLAEVAAGAASGPIVPLADGARAGAYLLRDPDGHLLELREAGRESASSG